MKFPKPKVKRCLYSKDALILALKAIGKGSSINAASVEYNVPRSTLYDKVKTNDISKKPGPDCVLSSDYETILEQWVLNCGVVGFPVTKIQLINSAEMLVKRLKINNPFVNNRPGRKWYEGFLQRHPNIAVRLSENLTLSRASSTEESLKKWYNEIEIYLKENDLLNIDANRVFNSDETNLSLNPKGGTQVLVKKGTKYVYNVVDNNEKESLSALITGNAAGQLTPPLILFTYVRLPKEIFDKIPEGWSYGRSDNGWMTGQCFYEWLTNSFHGWILEQNIQKPVILYVDGHASHLTLPVSEFCSKNQIILIALPANTTHLTQPMDVSLFAPLKSLWKREVNQYRIQNNVLSVSKPDAGPLLKNVLQKLNLVNILGKGFKTCGLHPFNANAIDFNKIVRRPSDLNDLGELGNKIENNSDYSTALRVLNEYISLSTKTIFEQSKLSHQWLGEEKHECLFYFWKELSRQICVENNSIDKAEIENNLFEGNGNNEENRNFKGLVFQVDSEGQLVLDHENCSFLSPNILDENLNIDMSFNPEENNDTDAVALVSKVPDKIPSQVEADLILRNPDHASCSTVTHETSSQINSNLISRNSDHIESDERKKLNIGDCKTDNFLSTSNKTDDSSGVVKQGIHKVFQDCLFWPKETFSKGTKRQQKQKMPSIISSQKWVELKENVENGKQKAAEEKELRKAIRLEKQKIKQGKDSQRKVKKTLKSKTEKKVTKVEDEGQKRGPKKSQKKLPEKLMKNDNKENKRPKRNIKSKTKNC